MGKTAILAIKIVSDAKDAARGFDEAAAGTSRFKSGLNAASGAAAGALVGIAALGAVSIQAASDAQQAAGAVESVFGKASAEVKRYAESAAENVGLAGAQYNQMAAVLGAQLKNLGISQGELAGQTNDLIKLGADLAATFGGTTADAVQALGALFRGETDPIEKYGVAIKQSDVTARMAADGLGKLDGEAKKQAETQTRLKLLYEQTAGAQGQLGRESDTLAAQQQRMNAQWTDAKAKLGEALLPAMTQLASIFANVAKWASENTTVFYIIIGVVALLAVGIMALNVALTLMAIAEMIALWPLALIVVAIIAVIAVVVLIIKNLDTLKEWWNIAFEAGRTAVQWCWDILKSLANWISGTFHTIVEKIGEVFQAASNIAQSALNAVLAPIHAIISAIQSLIGWISNIRWPSPPGWLSSLNPFSLTTPAPAGLGATAAPTSAAFMPRGQTVNITIHGAIDPVETGKQVRAAIRRSDRALGISAARVMSQDRRAY